MTRTRVGLAFGLLFALALAVAACGGGGGKSNGVASLGDKATATTSPGGSQDEQQAALVYARCMRQHGVNMPDPQITGNRVVQDDPPGMEREDPRLRAAVQACVQVLPPHKRGGGGG